MNSKHSLVKALAAVGLTVALTSGIALASIGTGTVNTSTLRLRSEASAQSATLAYAPRSAQVTILSAVSQGWYRVMYGGVEGYMSARWLDVTTSESDSTMENVTSSGAQELRQAVVTDGPLNVRSGPNTSYDTVGTLQRGGRVTVIGQQGDWYLVTFDGLEGYVSAQYLSFDLDSVRPEPRQAVVTDGPLNIRAGAGTSYDAIGTLQRGDHVTVTDQQGDWYAISVDGVEGYVSAQYLSFDLDSVQPDPKQGMVNTSLLNVRSGPGTSYDRVGSLPMGSQVTVTGQQGDWYAISANGLEGYVSTQYITILDGTASGGSSVGQGAAAIAYSLIGKPYVYGGSGPNGFDCSGLLYYIYRQLGYSIARGSSSQYNQSGYFVSADQIQPGDLVFFFDARFDGSGGTLPTTHAGIYVGNNQFIHAATTTYRVQADTLFGGYWDPYIVGFKRIA